MASPGLCECGCGRATTIAKMTSRRKGHVKGQPVRFLSGHNHRPLEECFWEHVDLTLGCWLWKGALHNGYGRLGRSMRAHRFAYELLVGPIPQGLDLDHLCRNRGCVNPAHLQPVTRRENLLRGETLAAAHAAGRDCGFAGCKNCKRFHKSRSGQ